MKVYYNDEEWDIIQHISDNIYRKVTHYLLQNALGEQVKVRTSVVTFINNR